MLIIIIKMGQSQIENSQSNNKEKDKIVIGSNKWLSIQENEEERKVTKSKTRKNYRKTNTISTIENQIHEISDENDLDKDDYNDKSKKITLNKLNSNSINSINDKNNTVENFLLTDTDNVLNSQRNENVNFQTLSNIDQFLEMNIEDVKSKEIKKEKRFESFIFEGYDQVIQEKNLYLCEKLINQQGEDYKDFINHDFKMVNEMLYNMGEIKNMVNFSNEDVIESIEETFNIEPKDDIMNLVNEKNDNVQSEYERKISFAKIANRKSSIYAEGGSTFLDEIRISKISNKEKKKLIDNYLNDILNINDKGFINKFSIVMHKYFSVRLLIII